MDKWNLGENALDVLETITMIEDGVTKINGGKIATNTIAANALAITDFSEVGATLSGWTLTPTEIRGTYSSLATVIRTPTHLADVVFQAGDAESPSVRIFAWGKLEARNAEITGAVKATSGEIGGWEIGTNHIRGAAMSFETILRKPTASDTVVLQSGLVGGIPAFRLTNAGKLKRHNAEIKGNVSATAFEVLNSDGVKIGGLYGTGTNAYVAVGRLVNPAESN